jgi:hypothetical protein
VRVKALDLRLELRKAENELRACANALRELLDYAKRSHNAVSAAIGLGRSGGMQIWYGEWDSDSALVTSLLAKLPDADADYSRLSDTELEAKVIEVHALYLEATRLQDKYQAGIGADDKQREQIRADVRARTGPRLT